MSDEPIKHENTVVFLVTPGDVLATWYRALGVPLDLQFTDHAGRPTPILPQGEPIKELV